MTDSSPNRSGAAHGPPSRALRVLWHATPASDRPTRKDTERVAETARQLARQFGSDDDRGARLPEAALLHDMSKVGIPDAILNKPGALTADEYQRVKTHAAIEGSMLKGFLDPEQVRLVRAHNEWADGRGYPDGLAAHSTPDGALMINVADTRYRYLDPRARPSTDALFPTEAKTTQASSAAASTGGPWPELILAVRLPPRPLAGEAPDAGSSGATRVRRELPTRSAPKPRCMAQST